MADKQKVLVIKLGALGDFVAELGAIQTMIGKFPGAEFTLMTHKSLLPIAKQMGVFSNYIIDNRESYWHIGTYYRIMKEIQKARFDCVLNFQVSSRTEGRYFPLMRWLSPVSFSWYRMSSGRTITRVKKTRPYSWGTSEVETFQYARKLTDLTFLHGENKHFDELPERFVTMIPGCSPGHPHKRWPAQSFAALAQRLAEHGIHSVIIGTKTEAEEIEYIAGSTPLAHNMLGKTSLLDIPDLAARALATVGNDTGPSHMTALSGTPMIGLFATRTKPCSIRGKQVTNIISPGPIDLITVDQVWATLLPYLGIEEK